MAEAAAKFAALAKNLLLVGEVELRRELDKAVKDAARPVAEEIGSMAHLRDVLPNEYADEFSRDLKVSVSARSAGTEVGVSVIAQDPARRRKLRRLDAGLLTHPLYGNRRHWYTQEVPSVTPGWFSGPAARGADYARQQILEAVRRVEAKATGKG